ncbi:Fc.00g084550.m01.CDS01 [Cosmosporella sp. VM-42]
MSKQTVLLLGATGETGSSILEGLIEDGAFNITCFVRTASAGKPAVQQLKDRGLKVVTGDLTGSVEKIIPLLQGINTVISPIFHLDVKDHIPIIDAAVQAGVKRFLPCNWGTPAARGGIMDMRDLKEEVHDHIFRQRLGYTIIDVGFWYQLSYPRVPSGKFDYATAIPINEVYAGGTAPNMIMHKKDVGRITAKIIKDERTLNKRVYAYGDLLSQNEVHAIIEDKTGEKLELISKTKEEVRASLVAAIRAAKDNITDTSNPYRLALIQYTMTKYVREDNTPENAEYLGYVNGRELYPDFKFIKFAEFVNELIAGKVAKPYANRQF